MFVQKPFRWTSRAALVLALAAAIAACDDSTGPDDDHQEAVGMVITNQNNQVLATVNAQRQVTGGLTVAAGQSQHIDIHFVDEDGDRFQISDDDDEHSLGWTVANTAIARIEGHDGHHDLDGVAAGNTTVVFSILHGNHSDYDSPQIPITVTP